MLFKNALKSGCPNAPLDEGLRSSTDPQSLHIKFELNHAGIKLCSVGMGENIISLNKENTDQLQIKWIQGVIHVTHDSTWMFRIIRFVPLMVYSIFCSHFQMFWKEKNWKRLLFLRDKLWKPRLKMPQNDLDRDDYFCYDYFVVVTRCEMFAYRWQDLYISVMFTPNVL